MSAELLASKVVVVEEEPKVRGIGSASTSVTAAIGVTERGPANTPVLCISADEYQATFGGYTAASDLALAVVGYFENGGKQLWVSRVVSASAAAAHVDLTATEVATPGTVVTSHTVPFSLVGGQGNTLVVSVDTAGGPGFDRTIYIEGLAGTVAAAFAEPYALEDQSTLMITMETGPAQVITFSTSQFADIGAATAAEVAAAINETLVGGHADDSDGVLTITSNVLGVSSLVTMGTGTAVAAVGMDPFLQGSGDGNVANIAAVTIAELNTLITFFGGGLEAVPYGTNRMALRSLTTGVGSSIRVNDGPDVPGFGFDTNQHLGTDEISATVLAVEAIGPGVLGNQLSVQVTAPTSGAAGEFDLIVKQSGVQQEKFINLSRDHDSPRYVEAVINDPSHGSDLVRVTNTTSLPADVPNAASSALTGGSDGGALTDTDFVGDEATKTGLHALDKVQDISILIVPGRATSAVHNAMIQYCEVYRDGTTFAVLDPPANMTATGIVTYVATTASLEDASEYAAIYWPRLKIPNPRKSVFGAAEQIVVPPSGILAGVYARTDGNRPGGVYDQPAGVEAGRLFGVVGFETDETLNERRRDLVYPQRINPLTTGAGLPRYADGCRTLKGNGNFPSVAERRGVSFIEQSLRQGLQFARHKNNTADLRAQVRRTVTAFLLTQMNNGAFRSLDPAKAFFVDVSDTLNTPSVVAEGKLLVRVGLATNKPTEFVILNISQDTRALDAELAAAG